MSAPRGKVTRFDGGTRPWNIPVPEDAKGPSVKYRETAKARRDREACLSCTLPDCAPYSVDCPVCNEKGRALPEGKRKKKLEPPEEFLRWAFGPMTNQEWADRFGVSKTTISKWRTEYGLQR